MEKRITGHTRLCGLIGSPVGHSGSPAMYNLAFALKGLDYAYLAFDVPKEDTGRAIEAMKTFHMAGCNVTMPGKLAVIPYLDELSPAAELMDAVNTIVNRDGRLIGYNTDGEGFVRNLADHGVEIKGKKIVICGGGGEGTAILVQCALDGAREVVVFNRRSKTFARVEEIIEKTKGKAPECRLSVHDLEDAEDLKKQLSDADILINATSVGMAPNADASVISDPGLFRPDLVVADAVYNPLQTRLLREAEAAGCKTVNGKGVLFWQGVAAFKLYTGEDMPVEEVKAAYFSEA